MPSNWVAAQSAVFCLPNKAVKSLVFDVLRTYCVLWLFSSNIPALYIHDKYEEKWRTLEDSNLWPLPSEGSALSS